MKASYGEGLANRTSLESCGNCSNATAEALTEGSAGGLLSSEITSSRVPTTWSDGEGNTCCSVKCELKVKNRVTSQILNIYTQHLIFTTRPHGFPQRVDRENDKTWSRHRW